MRVTAVQPTRQRVPAAHHRGGGGQVSFVELAADQEERLARNASEFRLERKRSHRDLAFSRNLLRDLDAEYVLNTGGDTGVGADRLIAGADYLRIESTDVPAREAAARIAHAFCLVPAQEPT